MNIDLKGFTQAFYKKVGGDLETVQGTIELASESCHVEVTTLIIPATTTARTRSARWRNGWPACRRYTAAPDALFPAVQVLGPGADADVGDRPAARRRRAPISNTSIRATCETAGTV
jgi:hypothetical protein